MKRLARFAAIAVVALGTLSMSGCEFMAAIFGVLLSVDGKVVNARAEKTATDWYKDKATSKTLVGATITLTSATDSSKTYTGEVNSEGKYYVPNVSSGRYIVTGKQDGWIFVPRTVDISGFSSTLPDVLAYVNPGDTMILLITEWEDRTIDVDMHLVVDTSDADALDPTASPVGTKTTVNFSTPTTTGITLERDIRKEQLDLGLPAVETILISSNPFSGDNNTGWLRLYLNAWTEPDGNLTGNSTATTPVKEARATVHAMQGSTHLGTFRIATETLEEMICVTKVQVEPNGSGGTDYWVMSPGNFDNQARSLD